MSGELVLYDGEAFPSRTGACTGGAVGYDDLATGSQVYLKDGSGALLGVGEFGGGDLDGRGGCVLPFSIADVPDADFYEVSTQSSRPGRVVSAAEIEDDGWHMTMQVGDPDLAAFTSNADCLPRDAFSVEWEKPSIEAAGAGRALRYRYRVSGTLRITNTTNTDATVSVSWAVKAPAEYLGMNQVAMGSELVKVQAGQTASDAFSTADLLTSSSLEHDVARASFNSPRISSAFVTGTRGGMRC